MATDVSEKSGACILVVRVVVLGEIGDKDVAQAIAVPVAKRHPHPSLGSAIAAEGRARRYADISKFLATVVAQEGIGVSIVGHVRVEIAICVEIAPGDLHTITGRVVNPRSRAYVTEAAVAVIAE